MAIIGIDDEWYIRIDTHGNHVPYQYKEKMKRGEGKEWVGTGEYDWDCSHKFFPNIPQAMRWIFEQGLEDMTLLEYVERIEAVEKRIKRE